MILGETYTDRVEVFDVDGDPGSAGSVTATITKPDGSTATPTINESSPGKYDIDYLTVNVGRHEMIVTATGGVLGLIVRKLFRVFYVDPVSQGWLVSLAEAKEYLNILPDKTVNDMELGHFIAVASEFVEARTQSWHSQTLTERYVFPQPCRENVLILRTSPVQSVTSVTENGIVTPSTQYAINSVGNYIWRTSGWWSTPVDVVYTVGSPASTGPSVMPSRVRHAVLVVLKHLWSTQRGALTVSRQGPDDVYDPRSSYSFPRAVAEILEDLGGAKSVYLG